MLFGRANVSQEGGTVPSAKCLYHGILDPGQGCRGGCPNPETVTCVLMGRDSNGGKDVPNLANKPGLRHCSPLRV